MFIKKYTEEEKKLNTTLERRALGKRVWRMNEWILFVMKKASVYANVLMFIFHSVYEEYGHKHLRIIVYSLFTLYSVILSIFVCVSVIL